MVVGLEILHVLARHAVLDEVVVPFHVELTELLLSALPFLKIEYIGHFLLLTILFQDPPSFLLAQQAARFFIQPAFVIIQHAQLLYHFALKIFVF